jgi:flagellar basal body-associated protein FliL
MTSSYALTRRAALIAALVAGSSPAWASSEKKKEGEAAAPDPTIKIQPFAVPIVENGRLINYVFVNLTLKMAHEVPVTVFAEKEPLLRDAIVRAAHRTPFTRSDSYVEVDAGKLQAAVMREAAALVGKGKIASVEITKQIPRKQVPHPSGVRRTTAPAAVASAAHH